MMIRLSTWISIVFSLSLLTAQAQLSTPKFSNEFMNLGVGARAFAMSGAVVSSSDHVQSSYWNPSMMLGQPNDFEASAMHAEFFAGIASYDYLALTTKLDKTSSIGVSVIRFGVDDIPDTRFLYDANGALNYDNIRFFSAADYGVFLSYARKPNSKSPLSLGGSVKIIHRIAGNFARAWGFGVDLSATYAKNGVKMAVVARDITGTFNAWTHNSSLLTTVYQNTNNEVPKNSVEVTLPRLILGISKRFEVNKVISILPELNLESTFDGKRNTLIKSSFVSIEPRMGLEVGYKDKVYVRSGISQFQTIQGFDNEEYLSKQVNFGLGLVISKVRIDYALTDLGDQAEGLYSHVFSLSLGINKTQ